MIRKPEILKDYVRMNPLSQVQFGNNVIGALMSNPTVFIPADLPVTAAELTSATNDLGTKYNNYKQNGVSHKEAFLVAQFVFVERFNLTADYVELVAAMAGIDAGTIIQLSTFHLAKTETEPATIPSQPEAEIIGGIVKGEVLVNTKAIKGAKGFCFGIMTPDFQVTQTGNQITLKVGNSYASFIIGTEREVAFDSLPSFIDAKATAAAFNSAGMGVPFTKTVTVP